MVVAAVKVPQALHNAALDVEGGPLPRAVLFTVAVCLLFAIVPRLQLLLLPHLLLFLQARGRPYTIGFSW